MRLFVLALSGLALLPSARPPQRERAPLPLAECAITIEHVVGGEAVVRVEAESEEGLVELRVLEPGGRLLAALDAPRGARQGLSGLLVELRETSLASLRATFAEGEHEIRACTAGGRAAAGRARLSFDLPARPYVLHPPPAALVPAHGLTVRWSVPFGWAARDALAGYRLQLEQGEGDGLAVRLPPGQDAFRVPDGILAPGTVTTLEVAAIGANGNSTVVEVVFATLP